MAKIRTDVTLCLRYDRSKLVFNYKKADHAVAMVIEILEKSIVYCYRISVSVEKFPVKQLKSPCFFHFRVESL